MKGAFNTNNLLEIVYENCRFISLIHLYANFLSKIITVSIVKLLVWERKDAPTRNLSGVHYHDFFLKSRSPECWWSNLSHSYQYRATASLSNFGKVDPIPQLFTLFNFNKPQFLHLY